MQLSVCNFTSSNALLNYYVYKFRSKKGTVHLSSMYFYESFILVLFSELCAFLWALFITQQ